MCTLNECDLDVSGAGKRADMVSISNESLISHLNAVPRPGDLPRPNGEEKKSSSSPPMDEKRLLW